MMSCYKPCKLFIWLFTLAADMLDSCEYTGCLLIEGQYNQYNLYFSQVAQMKVHNTSYIRCFLIEFVTF